MNHQMEAFRSTQIIFQALIIFTLFSYWAAFALLVVNPYLSSVFPAYRVGKLCVWELFALAFAYLLSRWMIKKWGNVKQVCMENRPCISMPKVYGWYFLVYFMVAASIGAYQYYLFTQQF